MNNKSPKNIALVTSILLAFTVSLTFLIYSLIVGDVSLSEIFLVFLVTALSSFFIVLITLQRFILSRIRLIYKTIYDLKMPKNEDLKLSMSDDIIRKVNRDVLNWADSSKNEIKKLKDKESFRREFIGNLSHELKTPVFAIQGFLLTLLEGGVEDPKIRMVFLERAAKSVDRMVSLIEDLDSIAQLEAGEVKLQKEKFDIASHALAIMDSLEFKAKQRSITLKFNQKYDRVLVSGDPNKIDQVLTNLLVNSINYGKEGGETEVRFFDLDEKILVEIADDGVGIPEQSLPRIFERFYRVDRSRNRNIGGSGLGLAICKHILDAHQQAISVRSTEEVGTTFSFTLPKA